MNPLMRPAPDSGGEKEDVRVELTGTWREKERHLLTNWTEEHLKEVGMTRYFRTEQEKQEKKQVGEERL